MIIKSYEIKKNKFDLIKNNFYLLYGENLGLKKDIKNYIIGEIKKEYTGTIFSVKLQIVVDKCHLKYIQR